MIIDMSKVSLDIICNEALTLQNIDTYEVDHIVYKGRPCPEIHKDIFNMIKTVIIGQTIMGK